MTIVPIACQLLIPQPIPEEILDRLAHRHARVQWSNSAESVLPDMTNLLGPQDWSVWSDLSIDLKERNPSVKTDVYVGGIATPDSHHPHFEWLTDYDQFHRPDGSLVEFVPAHAPPESGDRRMKTVNYSRSDTRRRLLDAWLEFLTDRSFDGLCFDVFNPAHYAAFFAVDLACPSGALEGAVHTEQFWAECLSLWCTELSAALEPYGLAVWANGLEEPGTGVQHVPYDPSRPTHVIMGEESTRIPQYAAGGALAEYCHRSYLGPTYLADFLEMAARVNAQGTPGGRTFYWLQPMTFIYSDPTVPWLNDQELARFYLCAYLLVGTDRTLYGYNPLANYHGYYDPELPASGGYDYHGFEPIETSGTPHLYDGGADWDLDVGAPVGAVQWSARLPSGAAAGQIASREYEHAYVVCNADDRYGWFSIRGSYRVWDPETGALWISSNDTEGFEIPGKRGVILFKQPAPIAWRHRMRARLQHVAQDEEGDITPGRSVTVYQADGVTLFDQVLYDAASGGAVVTDPATNEQGLLQLYADRGARARLTVSGLAGQYDSEFTPDPEDLVVAGDPLSIEAPGTDPYVLTLQSTTGGAPGNRGLLVLNADGSTALEVAPHGIGGAVEVGVTVPCLVVDHPSTFPRIYADLTAASPVNRLLFQSTVTNGTSDLGILPNGTSLRSALTAFGRSNPTATEGVRIVADVGNAIAALESFGVGLTGHDLSLRPNGAEAFRLRVNGNVGMPAGAKSVAATTGYFYVTATANQPTGTPTQYEGLVPIHIHQNENKLWANVFGVWKWVQLN